MLKVWVKHPTQWHIGEREKEMTDGAELGPIRKERVGQYSQVGAG